MQAQTCLLLLAFPLYFAEVHPSPCTSLTERKEDGMHLRLNRITEWTALALLQNVSKERAVGVSVHMQLLKIQLVGLLVKASGCASGDSEARFVPDKPSQDRDFALVTFAR